MGVAAQDGGGRFVAGGFQGEDGHGVGNAECGEGNAEWGLIFGRTGLGGRR